MIIFVCFIVVFLLSLWWAIKEDDSDFAVVPVILFFVVFIFSITIPLARKDDRRFIEKVEITRDTIYNFRSKNDNYEKTSLINSAIEINQDLNDRKYSNRSFIWWDLWTVDEIDDVEFIK